MQQYKFHAAALVNLPEMYRFVRGNRLQTSLSAFNRVGRPTTRRHAAPEQRWGRVAALRAGTGPPHQLGAARRAGPASAAGLKRQCMDSSQIRFWRPGS